MATDKAAPVTPSKTAKAKKRTAAKAPAVTPTKTQKTKKAPATPKDKWALAMSLFKKFMPGLGHDGTGLYGTLTNGTLRKMLDRCNVKDCTHVDVGAADGKVLMGAMSLGAKNAYGVEISGDALATKFNAMRDELARTFPNAGEAALMTSTDICDLRAPTVEGWLTEVFGSDAAADGSELTVSAVWHGFNIEAKEALLEACAASARVTRFSLIGPAKRDYGNPHHVIEFVEKRGAKVELVGDDLAHLSGSGENQRVITFQRLR